MTNVKFTNVIVSYCAIVISSTSYHNGNDSDHIEQWVGNRNNYTATVAVEQKRRSL